MIRIIAIGTIKEASNKSLIHEYVKRITPYSKFEIIEISEDRLGKKASQTDIEISKEKEGQKILDCIKDSDWVIVLDIKGNNYSSEQFSRIIQQKNTQGYSHIVFVIGGSNGISSACIQRANEVVKLSEMTFPHQLVRLLLVEQIYRAYKIASNEPYHK